MKWKWNHSLTRNSILYRISGGLSRPNGELEWGDGDKLIQIYMFKFCDSCLPQQCTTSLLTSSWISKYVASELKWRDYFSKKQKHLYRREFDSLDVWKMSPRGFNRYSIKFHSYENILYIKTYKNIPLSY